MRVSNEQGNAMLALIEQWEQSGMRQKDFYQKHNLPSPPLTQNLAVVRSCNLL